MRLLVRWLLCSLALAATAWLLPGFEVTGEVGIISIAVMAVLLGLLNATLKPLLTVLGCGFVVLTLGIGMLFINGLVFWLAGSWAPGISIDGYWTAFFAAIITSVISWALSLVVPDAADGGRKSGS
ncbi:MAG: phage holin family protein [Actinobacteria bacterium]|nr:MAG: phage holin family protein [Actinomycetota bacterium]